MNIAIYARVSTAAQAEHGYSLETQVEACRKKATELGATSIKEYIDDGYSGAYLERPKLDELRDAVSQKLHDIVIIYDIDRLARDTMHLLLLTEEIEKNAQLVYVNSEYNKTPEGQLFFEIRGSFAKYERLKIRDRFQRGMRGKLRRGLPISDHNIFGYDWNGQNYVINEPQAELVRKIFDMYINTLGGYRNVMHWLEEQGIASPKGKKRWSDCAIHQLLTRQMYTGEYYAYTVYHKKVSATHFEYIKRDKSEWIPMTCPAIIDKETFEQAQQKLLRNKVQKTRTTKFTALMSGILYCGVCGRKMLSRQEQKKSHVYTFYQCNSVRDKDKRTCTNHIVKTSVADEVAWDIITKICKSEKSMSKYIADNQPKRKNDSAKLQKELDDIESKRQAIMSWFAANLITAEQSTDKLLALKKQEQNIKQKLSTKEEKIKTADIVSAAKNKITFEEKRNFVLQNIKQIYIIRKQFDKIEDVDLEISIVFRS